ncbi:autotransporter domain-containing protein [Aminobacter anthyllidis]|uniref:autotransporter outer membrane beta-barrel domain-containing protein n=1 Tax=Aminobacter anthyllidis TaxID=1035067 RepID=UPI002454E57F|nr:autotransporter domain-containing protein [Aminobacter anthyllidis]MDH4987640.1 autotransporter domain-containing protein [Aminobacter anthyllidis]
MPAIFSTTRALSGVSLVVLCGLLQPAWADPVVLLDGEEITDPVGFDPFQEFVVGAGATGTYSGRIYESGEVGYIRKTGAGTLVVTNGSNSFSMGAIISGGAIRVTGGSVLGSGAITLDGGTLQSGAGALQLINLTIQFTSAGGAIDTGSFDLTTEAQMIDSDVSLGTGTFTKLGSGALILTNPYGFSNYATATNVAEGSIVAGYANVFSANSSYTVASGASLVLSYHDQKIGSLAGSGTVDLGSATLTTGNDNKSTTFSGVISGSGKLVKSGSGTQTLTGANLYSGGTIVDAGTLIVGVGGAGAIQSWVEVKSGARLGGSGTIGGDVTVAVGATHGAGNSIGTQTINGNYANHGILEVEATPSGADKLVVNGTVDISGATLNLVLSPATMGAWLPLNGPFTLIANDGGDAVTGAFASVGNLNNLLFLDHLLDYAGGDGNDVTLALSRNNVTLGSIADAPNQAATAAAVASLPNSNPVAAAFLMSTNEDEARDALNQLAGDLHASVSSGSTQTSQFLGEFANDRVRSAFGDVAAPDLPVMGYGEGGLELVAADTDRFVVWGQALGNWGSFDGDGNSGGFEHSSGGLVAGGDTVVGDGWRLGLLGGYSRTSFDTDDGAASGDSDNFHVGVYGGRHFGAVALRAGASYTRHAIDTSRTVSFPGLTETLKASYDAGTAQAFIETGYKLEMGRVAFEPFAGLAYVSTSTDGFTETGGAAALTSTDKSFDSTTTTLGLRAATDFNVGDAKATVRGGLGWRHAFGDVTPASTVAFAGGGDSFTVHGAPIARDALLVEAGLDFAIAPKANLALSYNGQIANGARDHGVKASLGVKF